jgi:hypothetical protein
MQSALLSQRFINVFQTTDLLRRTYYLNEEETKYVSIYINNDDLKPLLIIEIYSGHAVLNKIQWFILVTFKVIYPRIKSMNLETRNIPCQCTVYDIYSLRVRKLKCV